MNRKRVLVCALLSGVAVSFACGRTEPPSSLGVPAPSASAVPTSLAATLEPKVPLPPPVSSWAEAIRLHRWDEAASAIDALAKEEKDKPEVRYARARVAVERGEHAVALQLLQGLESELPLLVEDIAQHRAEAQLQVGPFEEAARYFGVKPALASQLKAALAYEKAKDFAHARAHADRLIVTDKRTRAQEAEARALRIRIAERPSDPEAFDARWLLVNAPDIASTVDEANQHAKLDPKHPLSAPEWMTRAKLLAEAGKIDEALRAIDEAGSAPGPHVPKLDRMRARGYALYRVRTRYLEAAKVLHDCAATGGPHAVEDAFHAARALSRADHDDDAIEEYEAIAKKFGTTQWGEQAAFYAPYLHFLHARWDSAARGFDSYLKNHAKGADRRDAARMRAIARLLRKDYKTARRLFEQLADETDDALASARMQNMAALAALGDGDRTHAISRWKDVAQSRPLSWPALVARARLQQLSVELPAVIATDAALGGSSPPAASPALNIALPAPADLLTKIGLDADAERHLTTRETSVTAMAQGRNVEALCTAYGLLGRARRRFQIAQQVPLSLLLTAPSDRTRWSWDCAYPRPYGEHVAAVEQTEQLPTGLVYAVMRQESGYDPDVVSPARAVGLMQIVPDTAKQLATAMGRKTDMPLTNPAHNIALGARYLRDLSERFQGRIPLAVAAYNSGPEAISRWMARAPEGDIDVFIERIPYRETREYVVRVMGNFARYAYLMKGEEAVPKIDLKM